MAVTDLTNTTWSIPSGWTATSGYGYFAVNCVMTKSSTEYIGAWLQIGYAFLGSVDSLYSTNTILLTDENSYNIMSSETGNDTAFTITFTGGSDVTNASLIAWLEANGEQVPSEYAIKRKTLVGIADSIRAKKGTSDPILTENMASEIESIRIVEKWDKSFTTTDAVTLISFTIEGTTYQAEEGMTWAEWSNSDYNTSAVLPNDANNTVYANTENSTEVVYHTSNYSYDGFVSGGEVIIPNESYSLGNPDTGEPT